MNLNDHGYEETTVEGMAKNVAAANPGEPIVRVDDEYGVDVVAIRRVPLSAAERELVLAGEKVTLADGAAVEMILDPRRPS